MSIKNHNQYTHAFTLVEILVFTAIISVFFIVAASITAFALSAMKTNEHRLYATHYAEQASEWLRNEKDKDWADFESHATTGAGRNWCLNSLSWPGSAGLCETDDFSLDDRFNRDINLISSTGNVVSQVTVSWQDTGGITRSVVTKTIFAQFE